MMDIKVEWGPKTIECFVRTPDGAIHVAGSDVDPSFYELSDAKKRIYRESKERFCIAILANLLLKWAMKDD